MRQVRFIKSLHLQTNLSEVSKKTISTKISVRNCKRFTIKISDAIFWQNRTHKAWKKKREGGTEIEIKDFVSCS